MGFTLDKVFFSAMWPLVCLNMFIENSHGNKKKSILYFPNKNRNSSSTDISSDITSGNTIFKKDLTGKYSRQNIITKQNHRMFQHGWCHVIDSHSLNYFPLIMVSVKLKHDCICYFILLPWHYFTKYSIRFVKWDWQLPKQQIYKKLLTCHFTSLWPVNLQDHSTFYESNGSIAPSKDLLHT